jgi:hypothetical protein
VPEYRIFQHPVKPVPDWKKLTMPETIRHRNKVAHSGIFCPVPDWDDGCRNADSGVGFLDADAHVWKYHICSILTKKHFVKHRLSSTNLLCLQLLLLFLIFEERNR